MTSKLPDSAARPSLCAAPGSEIFVLRMESDSVGWTADAEWAIEWERQLDGRNWEKVPEIIRDSPNSMISPKANYDSGQHAPNGEV